MKTLLFLLFGLALHAESLITLNVEPSKEHPRNSEGSFATLASGRVIFIYSQFYGGNGDESPARLVRIHSDDQGPTWSAHVTERPGQSVPRHPRVACFAVVCG